MQLPQEGDGEAKGARVSLRIRKAVEDDGETILGIILPIIRSGETYPLDPKLSVEGALAYWTATAKTAFVAVEDSKVVGTYYLAPNQPGGGAHVCNCGFMVGAEATGKGVARAMCEHALVEARAAGYRAMQFNFVVSSNTRAIALWERMGFDVVGRLPRAFNHPSEGLVDALVMYQEL